MLEVHLKKSEWLYFDHEIDHLGILAAKICPLRPFVRLTTNPLVLKSYGRVHSDTEEILTETKAQRH